MTKSMDNQLVDRYCELVEAHDHLPVHTMPVCYGLNLQEALNGTSVHVMQAKGGKLHVGWFRNNASVRFLFDAYGS